MIKTSKREHKSKIIELMTIHRDFVRQCRAGYHQRRAQAMSGVVPNIASIIVDGTSLALKANFIGLNSVQFAGMDQKKTCIPFDSVEQGSAADVASLRIPQMVFGGIIHGLGKYFYVSDNLVNNLKGADLGN